MTLSSSDFWSNQRYETCSHPSDKGPGHPTWLQPAHAGKAGHSGSKCPINCTLYVPHQTKREFPLEFLKADNLRRRKKKRKDQKEKGVEGTMGKESKRWKETPFHALGNDPGSNALQ